MIQIVSEPIDESEVLKSVQAETCGAVVLFLGTTRRFTEAESGTTRETKRLAYECFDEMAIKVFTELIEQASTKWPVQKCSLVHRRGMVEVGETSVAVAVGSPHRKHAFAAAEWLMDEVKRLAPIWKQENWADGSRQWIHPGVETDLVSPSNEEAP